MEARSEQQKPKSKYLELSWQPCTSLCKIPTPGRDDGPRLCLDNGAGVMEGQGAGEQLDSRLLRFCLL